MSTNFGDGLRPRKHRKRDEEIVIPYEAVRCIAEADKNLDTTEILRKWKGRAWVKKI